MHMYIYIYIYTYANKVQTAERQDAEQVFLKL